MKENCYTVVIPVFNSEKYIERCLNSIIKQTYKNLDIIVINDGSRDNSLKICNQIANVDKRVRVFNQKNKGVSITRNRGIEEAKGDFIIFVDSDDWIEKNTIESVNNEIEKNDVEMVMYGIRTSITKNKKKSIVIKKRFDSLLKKMIVNESLNGPVNKVYNLDLIKKYNIKFMEKIDIAEDLLFNFYYFININSMVMINDELYYCCTDNRESLSRKYNPNKYEQLMIVNNLIEESLLINHKKELMKSVKFIRIKNIFSCIIDFNRKQCLLTKKEKKQFIKKMHKENRIGILFGNGIKPFIYSCIYNIIRSPYLLLCMANLKNRK